MLFLGTFIAATELALYFAISFVLRRKLANLKLVPTLTYYWFTMTTLTCLWEIAFLVNYEIVIDQAARLLIKHEHVWTQRYSLSAVLPWRLSIIFYSEYGAYADREYMLIGGTWSRVVEGTHASLCGMVAVYALVARLYNRLLERAGHLKYGIAIDE